MDKFNDVQANTPGGHAADAIGFYRVVGPTRDRVPLAFPANAYEILAYAAPAWSAALGMQAGVGGPFSIADQVQLDADLPPGATFSRAQWDHSAQFNGTNMVRRHYWNLLMTRMGLTPW